MSSWSTASVSWLDGSVAWSGVSQRHRPSGKRSTTRSPSSRTSGGPCYLVLLTHALALGEPWSRTSYGGQWRRRSPSPPTAAGCYPAAHYGSGHTAESGDRWHRTRSRRSASRTAPRLSQRVFALLPRHRVPPLIVSTRGPGRGLGTARELAAHVRPLRMRSSTEVLSPRSVVNGCLRVVELRRRAGDGQDPLVGMESSVRSGLAIDQL